MLSCKDLPWSFLKEEVDMVILPRNENVVCEFIFYQNSNQNGETLQSLGYILTDLGVEQFIIGFYSIHLIHHVQ